MSYTQLLYHIVFRTKSSRCTLPLEHSEALYRYLWGFVNNHKSKLYRINGMSDHLHLLVGLHPSHSISDFMKELKSGSSKWIKTDPARFPAFEGWNEGYCAITYSYKDLNTVMQYIINQREHHKVLSFKDELQAILREANIDPTDYENM